MKASQAFLQGITAFDRMKSLSQNPYEKNTVQHSDWDKGYRYQQSNMRNK